MYQTGPKNQYFPFEAYKKYCTTYSLLDTMSYLRVEHSHRHCKTKSLNNLFPEKKINYHRISQPLKKGILFAWERYDIKEFGQPIRYRDIEVYFLEKKKLHWLKPLVDTNPNVIIKSDINTTKNHNSWIVIKANDFLWSFQLV